MTIWKWRKNLIVLKDLSILSTCSFQEIFLYLKINYQLLFPAVRLGFSLFPFYSWYKTCGLHPEILSRRILGFIVTSVSNTNVFNVDSVLYLHNPKKWIWLHIVWMTISVNIIKWMRYEYKAYHLTKLRNHIEYASSLCHKESCLWNYS